MSIKKKSLISTLKSTKKANVIKGGDIAHTSTVKSPAIRTGTGKVAGAARPMIRSTARPALAGSPKMTLAKKNLKLANSRQDRDH